MQLEGFGSTALLTAAEERKLGRKIQALLALEAKRDEAMERLGRNSLTTAEWMAEAGVTDAKEYKKILKVCSMSARIGRTHEIACCDCRGGCVSLLRCTMCTPELHEASCQCIAVFGQH